MYEYNSLGMYNSIFIELPVIVCDYELTTYSAWFWSYSNSSKFLLNFEKATAYDYSDK